MVNSKIEFKDFPNKQIKISKTEIKKWIYDVATSFQYKQIEVYYNFISDNELLSINRHFLKHDYYTDIITFDYSEHKKIAGEIFISTERVIDNAEKNGVTPQEEFLRVIIHGVLHLCGLKDTTQQQKQQMRKQENIALKKLNQQNMKTKKKNDLKMKPESLMMSYGYKPELSVGAIKCPIYQTSTFVFNTAEEGKGFFEVAYGKREKRAKEEIGLIYSRLNNPDIEILENRLSLWDNAEDAAVFESGMAAISTAFFEFLKPGDTFLYSAPLYGGTEHFINHVLINFGIKGYQFNHTNSEKEIIEQVKKLGIKNTLKMIYVETPSNPSNTLIDIKMCRNIANHFSTKTSKVIVAVDNTYLGPLFQHPLNHGADLVLYSATKYIGGHSDLIAGACLGSKELITRVRTLRSFLGNMAGPWTAWLMLRSLETLKVRMEQQAHNAIQIANYLNKHPKVKEVLYLGLLSKNSQQYKIYKQQSSSPGAMLSFYVKGGEKQAFKFLNALKLIKLAVSLGSTESLAEHPATMTHASVPDEEKKQYGILDNMVRLSIGIENVNDLIADIEQALSKV